MHGMMAELVDAVDSKSAEGNLLWVRFPLVLLVRPVGLIFLLTKNRTNIFYKKKDNLKNHTKEKGRTIKRK